MWTWPRGQYLMTLGSHKFVLSPRGNGLDAHRTWEAMLVGAIPIVRASALNPLYEVRACVRGAACFCSVWMCGGGAAPRASSLFGLFLDVYGRRSALRRVRLAPRYARCGSP